MHGKSDKAFGCIEDPLYKDDPLDKSIEKPPHSSLSPVVAQPEYEASSPASMPSPELEPPSTGLKP